MYSALDEHRVYLADELRLHRYREALAKSVRPGDVVLDLGSGTGVLGMLAFRAGASRVYAIDQGPILEVARAAAQANGFGDRIVFVREHSTLAPPLPERADVVVADQLGPLGIEAGLRESFSDARARHAKPDARFLPRRVTLAIAPVEDEGASRRVSFWEGRPADLDFAAIAFWASNRPHAVRLTGSALLSGEPATALVDPTASCEDAVVIEGSFTIERDAVLHGLAGWFSAELTEGVVLTNSPASEERIDREVCFLPLPRGVRVTRGDIVTARLTARPELDVLAWTVRAGGATFEQSTFAGEPISREELGASRPSYRPELSEVGEARRDVLSMCDGRTPLAQIEATALARFPSLFASHATAARFVARVLRSARRGP